MHILKSILFLAALLSSAAVWAQSKDTIVTFKVYGSCEMCKESIENAVDVKGVRAAEWDMKTSLITVTFQPVKITLEKIHELIAAIGYDTELKTADSTVYNNLTPCCKYERKKQ